MSLKDNTSVPKHYNQLTAAEDERLALLVEECSEVIEAAVAIIDGGLHKLMSMQTMTTKQHFERELGQVRYAISMLNENAYGPDLDSRLVEHACDHQQVNFGDSLPTLPQGLLKIIDACSKTIIAVTKIQRHGFESKGPYSKTNRERLTTAVGSLLAHIEFIQALNDGENPYFDADQVGQAMAEKGMKVFAYLHHNPDPFAEYPA